MAESRAKIFSYILSNYNIENLTEPHSAKITAEEIFNLYNNAFDSEEKNKKIRKELYEICENLDDYRLLNLTYHLMKVEIKKLKTESKNDLYLCSEKSFASILYCICATRFNYFFIKTEKDQKIPDPMRLLNQIILKYYDNYSPEEKFKLMFKDIFLRFKSYIIEFTSSSPAEQFSHIDKLKTFDKASIVDIMQNLPDERSDIHETQEYKISLIQISNYLKNHKKMDLAQQKSMAKDALNKLFMLTSHLSEASESNLSTTSHSTSSSNMESIDGSELAKDISDLDTDMILKLIKKTLLVADDAKKKWLDEFYDTVMKDPTGKWIFKLIKAHQLWIEYADQLEGNSKNEKDILQAKMAEEGGPFGGLLAIAKINQNDTHHNPIFQLLEEIYSVAFSKYKNNMSHVFHELLNKIGLLDAKEVETFSQQESIAFLQLFQNVIPYAMKRSEWNSKDLACLEKKQEQYVKADRLYSELPLQVAVTYKYMENYAEQIVKLYESVYKYHGEFSKEHAVSYLDILRPLFMIIVEPLISELEGKYKSSYLDCFNKFDPERNPNALVSALLSQILLIAVHLFVTPKIKYLQNKLENQEKLKPEQKETLKCYLNASQNLVLMTRIGPEVKLDTNLADFFDQYRGETILKKMIEASSKPESKLTRRLSELNIIPPINLKKVQQSPSSSPKSSRPSTPRIFSPKPPASSAHINQPSTLFSSKKNTRTLTTSEEEYLQAWKNVVNCKYWEKLFINNATTNSSFLSKTTPTNYDVIIKLKNAFDNNKLSSSDQLVELNKIITAKQKKYKEKVKIHDYVKKLVNVNSKEELEKLVKEINDADLTKAYNSQPAQKV